MPEHQRLLCRWTMELAALLVREHNLTKSRALELAHLNRKLLMRLGSGKVRFVYQKEQKGTGHAALCGLRVLRDIGYAGPVIVSMACLTFSCTASATSGIRTPYFTII